MLNEWKKLEPDNEFSPEVWISNDGIADLPSDVSTSAPYEESSKIVPIFDSQKDEYPVLKEDCELVYTGVRQFKVYVYENDLYEYSITEFWDFPHENIEGYSITRLNK